MGGSLRAIWLQSKYCYRILCTCNGQRNDNTPSPCLPVPCFGKQPHSMSRLLQHKCLRGQSFSQDPAGVLQCAPQPHPRKPTRTSTSCKSDTSDCCSAAARVPTSLLAAVADTQLILHQLCPDIQEKHTFPCMV